MKTILVLTALLAGAAVNLAATHAHAGSNAFNAGAFAGMYDGCANIAAVVDGDTIYSAAFLNLDGMYMGDADYFAGLDTVPVEPSADYCAAAMRTLISNLAK